MFFKIFKEKMISNIAELFDGKKCAIRNNFNF